MNRPVRMPNTMRIAVIGSKTCTTGPRIPSRTIADVGSSRTTSVFTNAAARNGSVMNSSGHAMNRMKADVVSANIATAVRSTSIVANSHRWCLAFSLRTACRPTRA